MRVLLMVVEYGIMVGDGWCIDLEWGGRRGEGTKLGDIANNCSWMVLSEELD
jgi:hypothetical protein